MPQIRPTFNLRKPANHPNVFDDFTPEQIGQINRWLIEENASYQETAARIKARFGKTISTGSVYWYWHRACAPLVARNLPFDQITNGTAEITITIRQGNTVVGTASATLALTPGEPAAQSHPSSVQSTPDAPSQPLSGKNALRPRRSAAKRRKSDVGPVHGAIVRGFSPQPGGSHAL